MLCVVSEFEFGIDLMDCGGSKLLISIGIVRVSLVDYNRVTIFSALLA